MHNIMFSTTLSMVVFGDIAFGGFLIYCYMHDIPLGFITGLGAGLALAGGVILIYNQIREIRIFMS